MAVTSVHLKLDDGWSIMEMKGQHSAIYWVAHDHPERAERGWKYVDLKYDKTTHEMQCFFCKAVAPTEALGFVNLLEGEMMYDAGGKG